MFSNNLKRIFRSTIKAARAVTQFAKAVKEIAVDTAEIYHAVRGLWNSFR